MKKKYNQKQNTLHIVFTSLMLTLALGLSLVESLLPPVPMLPPGVKIGLANIVTMYVLFFIGKKSALTIVIIRCGFIFITRGGIASILSLFGGFTSILVMILFMFPKFYTSYLGLSISGAIAHNLGQIIAIIILTNNKFVLYYCPILVVSGIFMGCITGIMLKIIFPYFNQINKSFQNY